MNEEFNDLLEPIELIKPFGLEFELSASAEGKHVKCNIGYVCKTGEMEI